jgi:hypothetical protein
MTQNTLKFPNGDFTHTELATFNGKTNQQVWVAYQKAIKDGLIVSAGTRASAGKGKPSKLWRLATGQPVPVVEVTQTLPVPVPTPTPVAEKVIVVEPPVIPAEVVKLEVATPAEPPVSVEVVRIEPKTETTEPAPVIVKNINKDVRTLTEVCPYCGKQLFAIDDATGVMVWCGQSPEVCPVAENPFGHGSNDKQAYYILIEKFERRVNITSVGSSRIKD